MDRTMFCFQCEQTAGCTGCTGKAGVCGKTSDVAKLQDALTGALVGLARASDTAPDVNEGTWRLMIEGLFTTVTNVNFNEKTIRELIRTARAVLPRADEPMTTIWRSSGTRRRTYAVSNPSFFSVCVAWRHMRITPWCWGIPMRK